MINKELKEITKTDLEWLVENQTKENRTLEFKSQLPQQTGNAKRDFLKEVVAFANAEGGDLVYGVRESEGVAAEIVPVLKGPEWDNTIRRLNDYLQNGVRPRFSGISFHPVALGNDDLAIVVRVQPSIFAPHAVNDGSKDEFFLRKENSVVHMSIDELRNMILGSEAFSKRIRDFLTERLIEVDANRYGYLNKDFPFIVLHAIPLDRFLKRELFSVKEIDSAADKSKSSVFETMSYRRMTFDGVWLLSAEKINGREAYGFYFVDGTVEIAGNRGFFFQWPMSGSYGQKIPMIRSEELCNCLLNAVYKIHLFYHLLGIQGKVLFQLSILNAREYCLYNGLWNDSTSQGKAIDRDFAILPELVIENLHELDSDGISRAFRPLFDSIWNAAGYQECNFYNSEGKFEIPKDCNSWS